MEQRINTNAAVEMMTGILQESRECGIIEDWAPCLGVPHFDIWTPDGAHIQITVRGDYNGCGHGEYADGRCGEMSCWNYYSKHINYGRVDNA